MVQVFPSLRSSVEQVKAVRLSLRWSHSDLVGAFGACLLTMERREAAIGDLGGRNSTADANISAPSSAGVIFINQTRSGVRLSKAVGRPAAYNRYDVCS